MKTLGPLVIAVATLAACQSYGATPAAQEPVTLAAASADEVPDFVSGVCGECHAVRANEVSPNPQAPGFADIANSPGVTRATLETFLSDAHNYPMQMDVDLVEEDIDVIADYLMTLQSDDYFKRPS